ncbi:MAG: nickel transporter [Betaproteobacteria bacterium]|nr:nickel transporter [Betaproteobacteria bacterium]
MLILAVFALGAKHGMDPDHLATIDGLTRYNLGRRPRLARWSGCLFSLGHGVVVTLVAGLVASLSGGFEVPPWLEHLGAWISILFLAALGACNIAAVFRSPRDQVVASAGLRTRLLGRFAKSDHPMVIASVGAAFALSFDTWSQTALFSIAAQQMHGWIFSVSLGVVFMAGMMAADGLNGLWVARLLANADRRALIASRVMSLVIGVLGLAIASLGVARYFVPSLDEIMEAAGATVALAILALILASFGVAMRITARVSTKRGAAP